MAESPAVESVPKHQFLAAIQHIGTDADLRDQINLGRGLHLTTGRAHERLLKLQHVANSLGTLEISAILKCSLIVAGAIDPPRGNEHRERLVYSFAGYVNNLLLNLWFIRDCSPLVEQCYLIGPNNVHANREVFSITTATGSRRDILFSRRELMALRLARTAEKPSAEISDTEDLDWWRTRDTISNRDSNRWTRFLGLIAAARSSPDLGLKIGHYCTALEALLSSGTSELRHILAARVALLVPPAKRMEAYKSVQSVYDQRSRVLHGSKVDKSTDLKALATRADELARTVAVAFFENDAFRAAIPDDKKLNDYFLPRLLGIS